MLLLNTYMVCDLSAQDMPLVYDVENTCADCPTPYLPLFSELPAIQPLPDPFRWSDGRGRITNLSDWPYRRAEIAAAIQHYEIGEKPARPDSITASYANGTLSVQITVNGNTLTLTSSITLPQGDGPFPAVIGMGGGTGSIPSNIFTNRDIAIIPFNFGQVMAHTQSRGNEPINELYPELEYIGAYSGWPWGVSRLIDGLELVQNDLPIDLKHLAVTGCSFAGKMAFFAGAFDERLALTIAQESGGGGYTTWRFSETLGFVETLARTSHAWFIEALFQFSTSVPRLPYDHHELMAMVAPRALLVTGNPDYEWLADESGHVGSKAAKEVWNALGVPDRFGFSITAGHLHCAVPNSQIPEIEAFVEKFLLGNDGVNTDIATSPYNTNLSSWIPWSTPTLSDQPSYYGYTHLISPPNLQVGLDTTVTLLWNEVEDAEEYLIQLSTDPRFTNIVVSDSTADTLKTVSALSKGTRYYWRVQVKNTAGFLGLWSEQWNFGTFISLPAVPQLVSAFPIPRRPDYVTFTWRKAKDATQYLIQLSKEENLASVFRSATTSDTVASLNGTSEGETYYWRVQANNIAGSGPRSDVSALTVIAAPTNLDLEISAANEITLSWRDNSDVEDGYIIERKQGQQTSFVVLDTLVGSGNQFVDTELEIGHAYAYRVRAYKDSGVSDYSNEVTLIITDVKEETELPTEYSISQNYPNPFNPTTKISYSVPKGSYVTLKVYNLLGEEVRTLFEGFREPGNYEVEFDGTELTSGFYLYQLKSNDFEQTRKLLLVK
jgi:hypothetical protein